MDFPGKYLSILQEQDPLLPFDKRFQSTISHLERFHLDSLSPKLIFRTRSPLVILLAPIFRKIQDRLQIVMGIEALNDPLHLELEKGITNCGLPRPSERLSAARTLHELGFNVKIKLQPYVGSNFTSMGLPKRAMEVFASICDSSASVVTLAPVLGPNSNQGVNFVFEKVLSLGLKRAELRVVGERNSIAA